MTTEERVAVGASLLDRVMPGWPAKIELERLDIQSCTCCVLGQLYGDYGAGFGALGISCGYQYGFVAASVGAPHTTERAWIAEIQARRGGAR